jgi:Lar family restriction alleviation protein
MSARLLPCPFCSARGRRLWVSDTLDDNPLYRVRCDNCGAQGPHLRPGVDSDGNYTSAEAREAWNTRNG